MIVNIRGTSGSGKSEAVRDLMAMMGNVKPRLDAKGKVEGYRGSLVYPDPVQQTEYVNMVSIVGRYETACGGCDTIKTQDEIVERVNRYALDGSVVFEGLLISVLFERYSELAKYHNWIHNVAKEQMAKAQKGLTKPLPAIETFPPFVFAFLDTPLEVCIARVKERRLKAGNTKPLNEDNTREKWTICRRVAEKFQAAGHPVVWLDHTKAVGQLKVILKGAP